MTTKKILNQSIEALLNSQVILYPTDTVWGLGCDATNIDAVAKIFKLKNRIERALGRKNLSRDEILKRINLQWSEEEKVNLADFVIHNDGSEEDLKNNVKSLIEKLI